MNNPTTPTPNGNPTDYDAGIAASQPTLTPELFAKTLFNQIRFLDTPPEAIPILYKEALENNNLEAVFCLGLRGCNNYLGLFNKLYLGRMVYAAAVKNVPYAMYFQGCYLAESKWPPEIVRGIQMLHDIGEKSVPEANWRLAQIYMDDGLDAAIEYAKKAADAGWHPAIDAFKLSNIMARRAEQATEASNHELYLARKEREASEQNAIQVSAELQSLKASSHKSIEQLQKRCEDAESRLASWSAEALKDEHILKHQSSTKKAEEDWLVAKCAQETAEALQIKAERLADDLTRRNKRLAGLLRKNRIAFNEYESSSSSEGDLS